MTSAFPGLLSETSCIIKTEHQITFTAFSWKNTYFKCFSLHMFPSKYFMNILKKIIQHCKNTEKKKEVSPRLGKSYFIMKLVPTFRKGEMAWLIAYIPIFLMSLIHYHFLRLEVYWDWTYDRICLCIIYFCTLYTTKSSLTLLNNKMFGQQHIKVP